MEIAASAAVLIPVGALGANVTDMPPTAYVWGCGFLPPRIAWILATSRCHSRASR